MISDAAHPSFAQQRTAGRGTLWSKAAVVVFLLFPAAVEVLVHNEERFFYLYLAAANLVSVGFCLAVGWRFKRGQWRRWQVLALAQALHVLTYLDAAAGNTHLLSYTFRAWFGNLAIAAASTLMLPALMSTRIDRGRPLRVLDTLLAVAFGTVLMFTLGSGRQPGDGDGRLWTSILVLALLSVLALVTRFAQADAGTRQFTDVVSKTIWIDLLTSLLVNGIFFRHFPDLPNTVVAPIAALPPLLLCYWSIQTAVPQALTWFSLDRIVIDSLQPSVLTLGGVVLSLLAFHERPLLAGTLIVFLVLVYAVRTQLFYARLFRERHLLQTKTEYLQELATRDPLTGIANRRWFEETVIRQLEDPSAYPCSLLMVDTDQFKEINDRHGHQTGDAVLCMIADVLQRETDELALSCVGRIGGDEFAVLLPAAGADHAARCAERIRSGVEQLGRARGYGATVSIGVGTLHVHGSRSDLLQAADEALYRAKAAGRNAVQQ